jgi:predicted aconitase with swiveling domain
MGVVIQGRVVVAGEASGELLVSSEPLSFWGGYDPRTGEIIDRRNSLSGRNARGRVLALPNTVGSSTTTAVLLEAVRAGTAPCALLTAGVDTFLALASVVAGEMYGRPIPIIALSDAQFGQLGTSAMARVSPDGRITLLSSHP